MKNNYITPKYKIYLPNSCWIVTFADFHGKWIDRGWYNAKVGISSRPSGIRCSRVYRNFFILLVMFKKKTHQCWFSFSQVPKTSVNLDGDVREKFMCHPSILTQGSWEWGVSQISTGRILHSGLNFRWTDFLYETFTPNPPYMVNTNTNKHNGIWFLVQMFQKESNLTKVRGEIYNFEWMFYI